MRLTADRTVDRAGIDHIFISIFRSPDDLMCTQNVFQIEALRCLCRIAVLSKRQCLHLLPVTADQNGLIAERRCDRTSIFFDGRNVVTDNLVFHKRPHAIVDQHDTVSGMLRCRPLQRIVNRVLRGLTSRYNR